MQQSINKFKNAGRSRSPIQLNNEQPILNVSQQAKERGSTESGNRRDTSSNYNDNFINNASNGSPIFRSINDNQRRSILTSYSAFSDTTSNNQKLGFANLQKNTTADAPQINDQNNNQMNNFMSQMVMLMQQNTALISQHQEILKNVTQTKYQKESNFSSPENKPAGTSRQNIDEYNQDFIIQNVESKTHIAENDHFSSLNEDPEYNDDQDEAYNPENIRAGSMSVERTNNLNIVKNSKYSNAQRFKKKHVVENKQPEKTNNAKYSKALAIVLNDVTCKINPNLRLLEGDIVNVERYIPELDLLQCRYNNSVGMYPKEAIKVVRKKGQKEQAKEHDDSLERRMESIEKYTDNNFQHSDNNSRNKQRTSDIGLEILRQDTQRLDKTLNSKYSSRNDDINDR